MITPEQLKKLKVGDKVVITHWDHNPEFWDFDGEMMEWMGKEVTIASFEYENYRKCIKGDKKYFEDGLFSIEEDDRWFWRFVDIDKICMLEFLEPDLFILE